ncbi:MAG: dephospho-CoA kinase [Actinobacteria bacterium]|nr:dephospho-CoA kinase [Actinomycetota bacterium]
MAGYIQKLRENTEILDVDEIAKGIYKKHGEVMPLLKNAFGDDIIGRDGNIIYKRLAKAVFSDPLKLEKINSIMFPFIRKEVSRLVSGSAGRDYVVIDAAVLFDAGLERLCDYIILVVADEKTRENFLRNKNMPHNEIKLKVGGQFIKIEREKIDFEVVNYGTREMLFGKTAEIIRMMEEEVKKNKNGKQ